MNTEQAYINGFVKRASEYGYDETEAINILKEASLAQNLLRGAWKGVPGLKAMPAQTPAPASANDVVQQILKRVGAPRSGAEQLMNGAFKNTGMKLMPPDSGNYTR